MSGDRWRRLVGALRGERGRRLARIAAWVGGTALALVVLDLLGVPVLDWIHKLFREIRQVPTSALIGGVALETVQTTFAAVAWTTILRAAFPNAGVPYRVVLACYATAVALNDFLPANIGSLVMLVMLLGVVAGATFAALVSGWVVQKIPSSVINIAVYLYLFLTVKGSFSIKLGAIAKHPAATVFIAIGAVLLVVIVARVLWSRTEKLRGQLKDGGAVLGQPKRFFRGVVAPEIVAYAARLGLIGVFLSAASIPVTFHTVVSVSASNSVSNSVSVTPGGGQPGDERGGVAQRDEREQRDEVLGDPAAGGDGVGHHLRPVPGGVGLRLDRRQGVVVGVLSGRPRAQRGDETGVARETPGAARQSQTRVTEGRDELAWHPAVPRLRLGRLALSWLLSAVALLVAAEVLPGVTIVGFEGAVAVAAAIGVLNALLPPVVAALRLPATVLVGFVALLALDALMIEWASHIAGQAITVDGFGAALLTALVMAATTVALGVIVGTNDDDEYSLRVTRRIARRQGAGERTEAPGILFLEIDGLGLPILRRAMQDGSAPNMARWLREGSHRLLEWETDLSSQTGASQAGILLGSNEDIPAFRWVEKESATLMSCSSPRDCAEIERRRADGRGLLADGGASRGNLLSGEAQEQILTVSRMAAEIRANPGYRAFLANGYNVTRCVVLFAWEVVLELAAAARQRRNDVHPRGHRGGYYPFLRAAMCVVLPELIVHAVLTDMMRGRPVLYATFSSYDEVAHHSGLERADTLEALRKLDRQFGRIERARRYAPRPYEIVVLSDHGQTQGATFKQRNGYGLDELVARSIERPGVDGEGGGERPGDGQPPGDGGSPGGRRSGDGEHPGVLGLAAGDHDSAMVEQAFDEATGRTAGKAKKERSKGVGDRDAVVLGSGNLGLIYLMEEPRRLTLEELQERHPRLIGALREHPDIGWLLVHSERDGPLVLGGGGDRRLANGEVRGEDPLAPFAATAARHLLRSDGFAHVADIMVGSFYDPELEEGCAFEELISFHGGLGGPQTRPFVLYPATLPAPEEPVIGAERLHEILAGWRAHLQGG
jgi:uncharacterized membrane protein YvlD (DUF360 family)